MSYVIIKMVRDPLRDKKLPVILLDSEGEVLEFNTLEEAEEMRTRFEINSDSGHKYKVKKIGESYDEHQ